MSVLHEKNFQSPLKIVKNGKNETKHKFNFSLDLKKVQYSAYDDANDECELKIQNVSAARSHIARTDTKHNHNSKISSMFTPYL